MKSISPIYSLLFSLAAPLYLAANPLTASAEPLQIGAILPLSGSVAPWGEKVRIGLETANDLHGSKFKISFEDEGPCEAAKALSAYRKLVSVDKVKIIFLGCLSGTKAVAPVAARDGILLLSLGLLDEASFKPGAKLVNLATEIESEAHTLSELVLSAAPGKLAGIYFADAFGQEFSRVMAAYFEKHGSPFVSREEAGADVTSFKSLITRWKQLKITTLVTSIAADTQLKTLLREMHELGFSARVFSTYVLECFAPGPAERALFEGIKYTHPVNSAEGSAEKLKVDAALAKRAGPGQSSNINAFFAYDGMGFLIKALEKCSEDATDCLYSYFTSLGTQLGVSGEMHFQKAGALSRPYGIKIVKNGEFEWIKK